MIRLSVSRPLRNLLLSTVSIFQDFSGPVKTFFFGAKAWPGPPIDGMGSDAMRRDAVGLDGIGLDGMGIELRTWSRKDGVGSGLVLDRGRIGLDLWMRWDACYALP